MADRAPLRVGVVLSTREWWRRLHAYATDHSADVQVVVVRDERSVLESDLQVVCTDDTVLWVTRGLVSRAEAAGITVVGVRAARDQSSDVALETLGCSYRVSDTVPPAAMLDLLARLRPRDPFEEIVAHLDDGGDEQTGTVTVVGGPPGAGQREVAIGLAAALGEVMSVLLIDANESSPGVARRLGLGLQPHLLDAVDLVAGGDIASALARPAPQLTSSKLPFDVVAGLPAASEWQRCSPAMLDALVEVTRRQWAHTVIATSPVVEDLHRWIDRYGLSRHLLATAERVVGVCEATPRGVLRYVDWLADSQPPTRVLTVINKLPGLRYSSSEVADQLRSLCGDRIDVVGSAPYDRRVVAAEWDAALPAAGPFTRALEPLAAAVTAATAVVSASGPAGATSTKGVSR